MISSKFGSFGAWFRMGVCSALAVGALGNVWSEDARFRVDAGDYDRRDAVVSLDLRDADVGASSYYLVDETDERIALQVDEKGVGWFILDELDAGESMEYTLRPSDDVLEAAVWGRRQGARVAIGADRAIMNFQAEPGELPRSDIPKLYKRGAYLHPIFSPRGHRITDDFPEDHVHHHGVWFAWTNTIFEERKPDFWNMGAGKGRVDFVSLDSVWSGTTHAGFESTHHFVDLTSGEAKVVLNEQWRVRVFSPGAAPAPYYLFDLESFQTLAADSALTLPEYRYGGLGFRGRGEWNGEENCFFLPSHGETDREKSHATRARWCHIYGSVGNDQLAGVAILGHPDNFRAPQPMRVHPHEPFFNFAPSQLGDWSIQPGQPYISRYRFVVLDGEPDADLIDRLWNDYAHPAQVARVE